MSSKLVVIGPRMNRRGLRFNVNERASGSRALAAATVRAAPATLHRLPAMKIVVYRTSACAFGNRKKVVLVF